MKMTVLTFVLMLAGAAHAEKSVWEQLESGTANAFSATVTHIDPDGYDITFKKDDGEMQTVKLCTQDSAINGKFYTEADRALALGLRLRTLRKSEEAAMPIKLAIRGPWSPCVYPLAI